MASLRTVRRHTWVVAETVMTLMAGDGEVAVDTELRYHSRDPFAVRMVFSVAGSQSVEWVFARELLISGQLLPSGTGDVQVFPTSDGISIELDSPSGSARLVATAADIASFVKDSLQAVPFGTESEYFDLDLELSLLAETVRFQDGMN